MALSWRAARPGHRGEAWLEKGLLSLVTALPVLADEVVRRGEEEATAMDRVIIGVDPHKRSVTFEARDTERCWARRETTGRCDSLDEGGAGEAVAVWASMLMPGRPSTVHSAKPGH